MKKIYLTTFLLLIFKLSQAQWTLSGTGDYYLNSGNVSIGTWSIGDRLTVAGSGEIVNISNLVDQDVRITLSAAGATDKFTLIAPGTPTNLAFGVGSAERMRITNAGYVGIGNANPQSYLHVNGSFICSGINTGDISPGNAFGSLSNCLANTGQMLIGWDRSSDGGETDFIANQAYGNTGGFAFYNHDNSNNETQLMWVKGTGEVVIGTAATQTSQTYRLNVFGSARANQIVVNTTGADFVFEPAYKLLPLSDVSKYINANHHLPGIIPARKMQADGLDLGDNQIKLLQKVEELTLYLIDKDKQLSDEREINNKQQLQIDAQKEQLKAQQERLEKLEVTVMKLTGSTIKNQ